MYMSLLDKDFDGHNSLNSLISTGKYLINGRKTIHFILCGHYIKSNEQFQ